MNIKKPIRIRKKNCLGSLVAVDRNDKPICVFATGVHEEQANELIHRWNSHSDLISLILQLKERWWPFVHGSVGASNTAINLLQKIKQILEKKY